MRNDREILLRRRNTNIGIISIIIIQRIRRGKRLRRGHLKLNAPKIKQRISKTQRNLRTHRRIGRTSITRQMHNLD